MPQTLIEIPIDEPLGPGETFSVDLTSTSKGGPMPGYLKQKMPLDAAVIKNFDGTARIRFYVNGDPTTVPSSTTESVSDVPPAHIEIVNLSDEEIAADDLELTLIRNQPDPEPERRSIGSAVLSDLNPLSETLATIVHGGQGHGH